MIHSLKKFYATLLTVILIMVSSVPFFAFAQAGTLGTEAPHLSATFKDGDDVVVDGNSLEAGSYTVDITLSGMKTVSIFQITADISNMTINSATTIANSDSSFSCGAIVNENNSFVAILASENENCSAIANGAAMVTLKVTVSQAGDFANMFKLSTDPDLTFVEADYADGYDDAYVCTENAGAKYALMTYDMSPDMAPSTFDVKGQIMMAEDAAGTATEAGIVGITVSVNDTEISAVTDENGYYTLSGLAEGTYTLSIAGETTVDREVTLNVNADKADANGVINVDAVGIVICNYYKEDTVINASDIAEFSSYIGTDYVYANLYNEDDIVNASDIGIFTTFVGQSIVYDNVTL